MKVTLGLRKRSLNLRRFCSRSAQFIADDIGEVDPYSCHLYAEDIGGVVAFAEGAQRDYTLTPFASQKAIRARRSLASEGWA